MDIWITNFFCKKVEIPQLGCGQILQTSYVLWETWAITGHQRCKCSKSCLKMWMGSLSQWKSEHKFLECQFYFPISRKWVVVSTLKQTYIYYLRGWNCILMLKGHMDSSFTVSTADVIRWVQPVSKIHIFSSVSRTFWRKSLRDSVLEYVKYLLTWFVV